MDGGAGKREERDEAGLDEEAILRVRSREELGMPLAGKGPKGGYSKPLAGMTT